MTGPVNKAMEIAGAGGSLLKAGTGGLLKGGVYLGKEVVLFSRDVIIEEAATAIKDHPAGAALYAAVPTGTAIVAYGYFRDATEQASVLNRIPDFVVERYEDGSFGPLKSYAKGAVNLTADVAYGVPKAVIESVANLWEQGSAAGSSLANTDLYQMIPEGTGAQVLPVTMGLTAVVEGALAYKNESKAQAAAAAGAGSLALVAELTPQILEYLKGAAPVVETVVEAGAENVTETLTEAATLGTFGHCLSVAAGANAVHQMKRGVEEGSVVRVAFSVSSAAAAIVAEHPQIALNDATTAWAKEAAINGTGWFVTTIAEGAANGISDCSNLIVGGVTEGFSSTGMGLLTMFSGWQDIQEGYEREWCLIEHGDGEVDHDESRDYTTIAIGGAKIIGGLIWMGDPQAGTAVASSIGTIQLVRGAKQIIGSYFEDDAEVQGTDDRDCNLVSLRSSQFSARGRALTVEVFAETLAKIAVAAVENAPEDTEEAMLQAAQKAITDNYDIANTHASHDGHAYGLPGRKMQIVLDAATDAAKKAAQKAIDAEKKETRKSGWWEVAKGGFSYATAATAYGVPGAFGATAALYGGYKTVKSLCEGEYGEAAKGVAYTGVGVYSLASDMGLIGGSS